MKPHDCPETDSLHIASQRRLGTAIREVADGLNVDIDTSGAAVAFDIDLRLDLLTLETIAPPFTTTHAA